MLDHLGIQVADMSASAAFYDAVLAPLGATRLMDFGMAMGYGVAPKPDFWIGTLDSGAGFREGQSSMSPSCRTARSKGAVPTLLTASRSPARAREPSRRGSPSGSGW